jgi:hypothetical protein
MKLLTLGVVAIIGIGILGALPQSAHAKAVDRKAVKGDGCQIFSSFKSDLCGGGTICQRENLVGPPASIKLKDCATSDTAVGGENCTGICRLPSDAEAQFGLGTESKFRGTGIGKTDDLKGTIANIINIVLGFLGILAVILILFGGFKIMTSAGNEDQTAAGKSAVSQGVIGLVIIFAAWGIATFVISQLQSATTETAPVVATGTCVDTDDDQCGEAVRPQCMANLTEDECSDRCALATWTEGESC